MKNKKAQIGDLVTALPTFLIILFIMAIFVFLSSAIIKLNPISSNSFSASNYYPSNPLLQTIEIDLNNKKTKVLLIDAIVQERKGDLGSLLGGRTIIDNAIKSLLKKENECIIVLISSANQDYSVYAYKKTSNEISGIPILIDYEKKNLLNKINLQVDAKSIEIEYYQGGCLQ